MVDLSGVTEEFNHADLIYCVKKHNNEIVFQNEKCKSTCGQKKGEVCISGCMSFFQEIEKDISKVQGFRFYKNKKLNNGKFDIVIFKDKKWIVSLLHESVNTFEQLFSEKGLTKREFEIATLRFEEGLTHHNICEKLFISKATLKTHINNILKKIPYEVLTHK